jgi:hypothetical protein
MRRILLFVASFLLLVGYLYFHQKYVLARIWSSDDCRSCTTLNCCGSTCDTGKGYRCNNLGYGICFCDKQFRAIPLTSTPGPRPPAPTQPGGGGGGGGGPTPTGGYGGTESHPLCIRRSAINNQRYAISDKRLAIRDTRLAICDTR